jgi:hypothetical protein
MTTISQSAEPMHVDDYQSFVAIQPSGIPMRVISGVSKRDCWNRLMAESARSIAELRRAGWRVERDEVIPGTAGGTKAPRCSSPGAQGTGADTLGPGDQGGRVGYG